MEISYGKVVSVEITGHHRYMRVGTSTFLAWKGECRLFRGREFKLLARNEFDGEFIASGAVAGNALILRSHTHLYCIEETNLSENNLK